MKANEQIKKLIPGGEISMNAAGTWTNDKGIVMPKGASMGITFGKKFVSLRVDQWKALFEAVLKDDEVKEFIGITY